MSSAWKTTAIAPAPAGLTVTTENVCDYAHPAVALLLQTSAAEGTGEEITRVVLGVALDTGEVIPGRRGPRGGPGRHQRRGSSGAEVNV